MARLLYFKHSAHFDNPARRIFLAGEQAPNWDTVKKDMKDTKWLSESGKAAAKELADNWQKEINKLKGKSATDRSKLLKDIAGVTAESIADKSTFETKGKITIDLNTPEGKTKFEKKGMLEILANDSGALGAAFSAFKNLKLMAYATVYTQLNAQDPPIDANYLPDGSTLQMTDGEITLTIPDGNGGTQIAKIDLFPWDLLQKEEAPAVAAVPPTPAAEPPAAPAPAVSPKPEPIAPPTIPVEPGLASEVLPIAFPPTSPDPDISGVATIIPEATTAPSSFVVKVPGSVAEVSNREVITGEKPSDVALEKRYVGKDSLKSISVEKPQLVDVKEVEAAQAKELLVKKEKIKQLSAEDTIAVAASVLGKEWIDQQAQKGITEGTSAYVTAAKAELTARLTNPNTVLSVETVPAETTTPPENKLTPEQEAAAEALKLRVGNARFLLSKKVAETYKFPDGGNGLSVGGDLPQVQWSQNGTAELVLGKLIVDLQSNVLDTFPKAKRSIELEMQPLQLTTSKDGVVLKIDITADELAEKMFTAFQEAAGEPEVRFNWMGNLPKSLQDKYEMSSHESMAAAQMRIVEARLANPDRRFAYAKDGSPSFLLIEKTSSGARAVEVQVASDWSNRLAGGEQIFTVQGGAKFFDENGKPLTSSRVTTESGTNTVQFNTLEEVLAAKTSPQVAETIESPMPEEIQKSKNAAIDGFGKDAEAFSGGLGIEPSLLHKIVSNDLGFPTEPPKTKVDKLVSAFIDKLGLKQTFDPRDLKYEYKDGKATLSLTLDLSGNKERLSFNIVTPEIGENFTALIRGYEEQTEALDIKDYSSDAILKNISDQQLLQLVEAQLSDWNKNLATKAAEGSKVAEAQAEHTRLAGEMQKLASRNAWMGVEKGYRSMQNLETKGVFLTYDDHMLGAQSARALGSVTAVRERLVKAQAITPTNEVKIWLAGIDAVYESVNLTGKKLEVTEWPVAPEERVLVEKVIATLAATGKYDGLMPIDCDYTLVEQNVEQEVPEKGFFSRILSRLKGTPDTIRSAPRDTSAIAGSDEDYEEEEDENSIGDAQYFIESPQFNSIDFTIGNSAIFQFNETADVPNRKSIMLVKDKVVLDGKPFQLKSPGDTPLQFTAFNRNQDGTFSFTLKLGEDVIEMKNGKDLLMELEKIDATQKSFQITSAGTARNFNIVEVVE